MVLRQRGCYHPKSYAVTASSCQGSLLAAARRWALQGRLLMATVALLLKVHPLSAELDSRVLASTETAVARCCSGERLRCTSSDIRWAERMIFKRPRVAAGNATLYWVGVALNARCDVRSRRRLASRACCDRGNHCTARILTIHVVLAPRSQSKR